MSPPRALVSPRRPTLLRPRSTLRPALLGVSIWMSACLVDPSVRPPKTVPANPGPVEAWAEPAEAAPLAPVAFRSPTTHSVVIAAVERRSTVRDPIDWTELRILLRNDGASAVGTLDLTLPGSTFTAQVAAHASGASVVPPIETSAQPLVELREPVGNGDRRFRLPRVELAPGEKKEILIRHASALVGSGLAVEGTGPFSRETVPVSSSDALRGVVLLLDTSVARARDLGAQARLARSIATRLAPETRLVIAAYDEDVSPLYDGPAAKVPRDLATKLDVRGAFGISQTTRAIEWALGSTSDSLDRIVHPRARARAAPPRGPIRIRPARGVAGRPRRHLRPRSTPRRRPRWRSPRPDARGEVGSRRRSISTTSHWRGPRTSSERTGYEIS